MERSPGLNNVIFEISKMKRKKLTSKKKKEKSLGRRKKTLTEVDPGPWR